MPRLPKSEVGGNVITSTDIQAEILQRCRQLDEAIDELKRTSTDRAEAEHKYRKAKAEAYLSAEGTIPEREAQVIQETADLRFRAKLAEDLRQAALEALRSRRAQLSAAQSLARAVEAETDLEGKGPEWRTG